jgi:hypothetical protein
VLLFLSLLCLTVWVSGEGGLYKPGLVVGASIGAGIGPDGEEDRVSRKTLCLDFSSGGNHEQVNTEGTAKWGHPWGECVPDPCHVLGSQGVHSVARLGLQNLSQML